MRNLLRVVLLSFWPFLACWAQPNSIQFGAVELRIGMAKAEVLSKLGTNYTATQMKTGDQMDMWYLTPKVGIAEDGSVQFWEGSSQTSVRYLGKWMGTLLRGV